MLRLYILAILPMLINGRENSQPSGRPTQPHRNFSPSPKAPRRNFSPPPKGPRRNFSPPSKPEAQVVAVDRYHGHKKEVSVTTPKAATSTKPAAQVNPPTKGPLAQKPKAKPLVKQPATTTTVKAGKPSSKTEQKTQVSQTSSTGLKPGTKVALGVGGTLVGLGAIGGGAAAAAISESRATTAAIIETKAAATALSEAIRSAPVLPESAKAASLTPLATTFTKTKQPSPPKTAQPSVRQSGLSQSQLATARTALSTSGQSASQPTKAQIQAAVKQGYQYVVRGYFAKVDGKTNNGLTLVPSSNFKVAGNPTAAQRGFTPILGPSTPNSGSVARSMAQRVPVSQSVKQPNLE